MEPRSKRRRRRSPPPPPQYGAGDRISALPDDMLIQVLLHLRCARAAARTGLLSRRWRGLWPRLPGLTFRCLPAGKIKSALAHVPRRTALSRLEIHLWHSKENKLDDGRAKSLLLSAARLSPEEIVFILPQCPMGKKPRRAVTMVLPCFQRATSIELDTCFLRIKPPPAGELPMVETLSISGNMVDLAALLKSFPRLRVLGITFRGGEPRSLQAELATLAAAAALGLKLSRLGIVFANNLLGNTADDMSLLPVAARLSPQEFLFSSSRNFKHLDTDLPCFHRTTSIEMTSYDTHFTQLPADEFSALERLALHGCTIPDLATMIIGCPRLRVLKLAADKSARDVKVHSVSLEELQLNVYEELTFQSIHIVTPILKKLNLSVQGKTNLGVSISAPMVEVVYWCHNYTSFPRIFGFWCLHSLKLESYRHKDGVIMYDHEDVCSHLPRVHVLSMEISPYKYLGVVLDLEPELEKLLIIKFSVLELRLNAKGHVFGALVLRLLRMHHIRTNTRKLKIVLPEWFEMLHVSKCHGNCHCDVPKDWRSQSISLTRLEEVEINNFTGGDHEVDFVRSIFVWAPMLTRIIIKLPPENRQSGAGGWATTIYNIFLAHPSVNCSVYLYSNEKWNGPLA